MHQGHGQVEAPRHSSGVGAGAAVERIADVDQLAQLLHPTGPIRLVETVVAALQVEQLASGLLGVERT